MALLTRSEIIAKQIVRNNKVPNTLITDGFRSTTFDSTVGQIIDRQCECQQETYTLKPRGIVWIISHERFRMPKDVTGITTLRTTWTRVGILTLTVGIVDPGYDGPLSTAVINFSKNDFCITKGDSFFRTAFFSHTTDLLGVEKREESAKGYTKSVTADRAAFSDTFLTIDSLARELVPKILGLPRWGIILGSIALGLGLLGTIAPAVIGMGNEIASKNAKIDDLEHRIKRLEKKSQQVD